MKKLLLCLLVSCMASQGIAQLNISFDFSNADATIALLKKKQFTATEIDDFIKTDGVQVITKKIKTTDSCARQALQAISKGETPKGYAVNFQYGSIKQSLPAIDSFITLIKRSQQRIRDTVQQLAAWLPAGKQLNIKIAFLLGGYSAGFTFYNSEAFYIGAHQYQNDVEGIIEACRHELFHNVQHAGFDSNGFMEALQRDSANKELYAYYLASNLFLEGTAEFVSDIEANAHKGPFLKDEYEHSSVNKYRVADNFYLIDQLITQAYDDPQHADMEKMYSILFDWNWNNPGYFTGKLMAQALANEYGRDQLKKYLLLNPMVFIQDYIRLARSKPSKYPYNFSDKFETVIQHILKRPS